jgi:predicted PurR-regulated permease PerM
MQDRQYVISLKTIFLTFLFILGLYIVYRLGPILGILVVSLLIVVAVEPMVKYLMKQEAFGRHLSRGFSVVITYVILVAVTSVILTLILPNFILQSQKLLTNLSGIFEQLNLSTAIDFSTESIVNQVTKVSSGFITALYGSFRVLATIFTVLILSIYMSSDWDNIKIRFARFFPDKLEQEIMDTLLEIETSLATWVKGQLFLMAVVGTFSTLGLIGLDVKYALALGLLAGLLEVVPMIGPVISAVFAGIVAFVDSPVKAIGVIILFIIIQQLENNILVPKIMQKVSGFSPLIILLALMVGGEFFGLLGAVLSVPITMVGAIVLKRTLRYRD